MPTVAKHLIENNMIRLSCFMVLITAIAPGLRQFTFTDESYIMTLKNIKMFLES